MAGVFIPLGGSSAGKNYRHDPPKYRQLTVLFHTEEGICSSPVKEDTIELNDEMDHPDHAKKMEIPKLVSEMESPEHDKMESQEHNNEMDPKDTITLDDTCESAFESHIPELAQYFPSPATKHTHRLGYSSSGSDATSPNPVSRSHPPQESRIAGVTSSSRNSQAINGHMFSMTATPVTNYSRLPQSPLTTSAPGNTTRFSQSPGNTTMFSQSPGNTTMFSQSPGNTTMFSQSPGNTTMFSQSPGNTTMFSQSLQSVAAPSLSQNERAPQAAATLAIAPIVYNARTPMAAAALVTSSNGYHAGTPQGAGTMATSSSGYNAGIHYQLVLPLYDGHLQDAGYSAPDDSRIYGNSLFFEDTFDFSSLPDSSATF